MLDQVSTQQLDGVARLPAGELVVRPIFAGERLLALVVPVPAVGEGLEYVPRPKYLVQRVLCVNRRGCPLGSRPQAFIVPEIIDEQAPSQLVVTGGDVFDGWINTDRTLTYTVADDGSGIKSVRAVNDQAAEIGKITNDHNQAAD